MTEQTNKRIEKVLDRLKVYGKDRLWDWTGSEDYLIDFIKKTLVETEKEERQRITKVMEEILEKGHGGGNWRRLLILSVDKIKQIQ